MSTHSQNTIRPVGLLTIAPELRLQIYQHLLPLHIDTGILEGLVLSCRLIKTEVYDEMKKEAEKVRVLLESRWPFDEKFRVPFPGRFFSGKDIVIELPYLLQDEMATAGRANAAGNTKWGALLAPHHQYLPSNRVTFVIGHIEGNPDLETVLGIFKAGSYLRSLQGLYWRFLNCTSPGTEQIVKFGDSARSKARGLELMYGRVNITGRDNVAWYRHP